ncbi:hypothetical protein K443DRAFT_221271 [Laccaria amethystina LaAM-08-1]|uniref:Uncharacterized protein n=1 Tax=Laccaria amethystina LaAM-08-1 TaxID=1095629 RepID=A0A0C9WYZ2_9AGAR|nr:hypothetical protein K443DRAFT_221271 [Laccaria amethystina LaAM-08-1]
MAFSTQHFRNSLARFERRVSDTPLPMYFHGTVVFGSGPAMFLPRHTTTPYLFPSYQVWLKAYGNRGNVNDDASFLDSRLRCRRNASFTDT